MKQQELTEKEYSVFSENLTPIVTNTLEALIKLADKHNIDRDSVVQYFSDLFKAMSTVATFKGYEVRKNQPTAQSGNSWIPVNDHLPEDDQEVLVCTKSKNGTRNVDKGYILDGRWVHRGTAEVTHWMPIPVFPGDSP